MNRQDILDRLAIVTPALSDNQMVPILTHYWFTGTKVMAFNDQIAISTPFPLKPLAAAVPNTLVDLLKSSGAKDVDFDHVGSNLMVKAGSSRFKLPTLPPDAFIFKIPASASKAVFSETQLNEFLSGVEHCMRAVGKLVDIPEQLGLTLESDGDGVVDLFATTGATIAHAEVSLPDDRKLRVILPAEFCKQMIVLGKKAEAVSLDIADKHALFVADDTMLFGRLLTTDHPLDFLGVIEKHFPDFFGNDRTLKKAKVIPVPPKLEAALERAVIIAKSKLETVRTTITFKDDQMTLHTKAEDRGAVSDVVIAKDHPNLVIKIDPVLLQIGHEDAEHMTFNAKCAVMICGKKLFMISCQKAD